MAMLLNYLTPIVYEFSYIKHLFFLESFEQF